MEKVSSFQYTIEYNGKNITKDISQYILDITYTDNASGTSDELEIRMDDTDHLWQDKWYPEKGDKIVLRFGFDKQLLQNSGEFEVDELVLTGPPDVVSIKSISTGITKALRTPKSKSFEKVSLKQIVQEIANIHKLKLVDSTPVDTKYSTTTAETVAQLLALRKKFQKFIETTIYRTLDSVLAPIDTNEANRPANETVRIGRQYKWIYAFFSDKTIPEIADIAEKYDAKNMGNNPIKTFLYSIDLSFAPVGTFPTIFKYFDLAGRVYFGIPSTFDGTANECPMFHIFFPEIDKVIEQVRSAGKQIVTSSVSMLQQLRIERSTQYRQTDLQYLDELAKKFGFSFSIKGDQLIFISTYKLHESKPIRTITRKDISTYRISDRTEKIGNSSETTTYYPDDESHVKGLMNYKDAGGTFGKMYEENKNADGIDFNTIVGSDFAQNSADTHKNYGRAENNSQAIAMAQADTHKMIVRQRTAVLTMEGDEGCVAGVNVILSGFGKSDGKYFIDKSSHKITKNNGYGLTIDLVKSGILNAATKKALKKAIRRNSMQDYIPQTEGAEIFPKQKTNRDGIGFKVVK